MLENSGMMIKSQKINGIRNIRRMEPCLLKTSKQELSIDARKLRNDDQIFGMSSVKS